MSDIIIWHTMWYGKDTSITIQWNMDYKYERIS